MRKNAHNAENILIFEDPIFDSISYLFADCMNVFTGTGADEWVMEAKINNQTLWLR